MSLLSREALLRYIDAHCQSTLNNNELYHRDNDTCDLHKLQGLLLTYAARHGLASYSFPDGTHFLRDTPTLAPRHALLLFLSIDDPARAILPLLAGLLARAAYDACYGTVPVQLTWAILPPTQQVGSALRDSGAVLTWDATWPPATGCLCYENDPDYPQAEMVLGTKGYLHVTATIQTAPQTIPARFGTIVPNAAWRLLWGLATLKNAREEVLIEHFYDDLAPLTDEALALLRALPDLSPTLTQQWGLPQLLLGLQGLQLHYAQRLIPACTLTHISSGENSPASAAFTELPTQARAELAFHLVPDQDPYTIFSYLQQHLSSHGFSDIEISLQAARTPASTPVTHPFIQQVCHATEQAGGHLPTTLPIAAHYLPLAAAGHALGLPFASVSAPRSTPAQELAYYARQLALLIDAMTQPQ